MPSSGVFRGSAKRPASWATNLDTLYPDVDWEGTRGVGNILRHQYDEVDNPTIWFGIIEDVPKLRQSALDEIARLDGLHAR